MDPPLAPHCPMKIATWNVNSLRVRLPHVLDWLKSNPVDVLGLQELKIPTGDFPHAAFSALGYMAAVNGQKTYNGVALVTRRPAVDVQSDIPGFDDDQKRVISATVDGVRVVNVYVPNGQSVGSGKYDYKLRWMQALRGYLAESLEANPLTAVTGDFNVAPADEDVHDPGLWEGQVLFSEAERAALRALLDLGLRDAFRLFPQAEKSFTWWDYRLGAFRRNRGLRIDHILVSEALAGKCQSCRIDTAPRRLDRPSDHAPVIADFS